MREVVEIVSAWIETLLYLVKGHNVFCVLEQTGEETGLPLEQRWFGL